MFEEIKYFKQNENSMQMIGAIQHTSENEKNNQEYDCAVDNLFLSMQSVVF